jgi:hypothetical protein
MTTLVDDGFHTLLDVARAQGPDGGILPVAEVLDKELDWLKDIPWVEGNLSNGHKLSERTAIPSMVDNWRTYNKGVKNVKPSSATFDEVCGMLEVDSKVDVDLANLNGNAAAYRASQSKPVIEAMSEEFARAVMYESTLVNPQKIHGLTPRYAHLTGYRTSPYVVDMSKAYHDVPNAGGANCKSIWIISWDTDSVFGIYPKGSVAGLQQIDRGIVEAEDADGLKYEVYKEKFKWKCGIAVNDYRYAVRLQYDPDDPECTAVSGKRGLYLGLLAGLETIRKIKPTTRIYMDRATKTLLTAQLAVNEANFLQQIQRGSEILPHFNGVAIRLCDALVAEDVLT